MTKRTGCYEHMTKMKQDDLLQDVINYLKGTKDDDWCVDVVRNEKKNCFLGHLFNFGGNLICNIFESGICNEHMYYEINDGKSAKYTQSTPKQRIIAYLENLRDGKEKSILELMNEENNNHY